jgi:hypothetical protein
MMSLTVAAASYCGTSAAAGAGSLLLHAAVRLSAAHAAIARQRHDMVRMSVSIAWNDIVPPRK